MVFPELDLIVVGFGRGPGSVAIHGAVIATVLVRRGRFRTSFEKPPAVPANTVLPYTLDLHSVDYRFLRGHRIMVQVQSSWFPLIDQNPQTYMPSIFGAKPHTRAIGRQSGEGPLHRLVSALVNRVGSGPSGTRSWPVGHGWSASPFLRFRCCLRPLADSLDGITHHVESVSLEYQLADASRCGLQRSMHTDSSQV